MAALPLLSLLTAGASGQSDKRVDAVACAAAAAAAGATPAAADDLTLALRHGERMKVGGGTLGELAVTLVRMRRNVSDMRRVVSRRTEGHSCAVQKQFQLHVYMLELYSERPLKKNVGV